MWKFKGSLSFVLEKGNILQKVDNAIKKKKNHNIDIKYSTTTYIS